MGHNIRTDPRVRSGRIGRGGPKPTRRRSKAGETYYQHGDGTLEVNVEFSADYTPDEDQTVNLPKPMRSVPTDARQVGKAVDLTTGVHEKTATVKPESTGSWTRSTIVVSSNKANVRFRVRVSYE